MKKVYGLVQSEIGPGSSVANPEAHKVLEVAK